LGPARNNEQTQQRQPDCPSPRIELHLGHSFES
jgi:hypothetical protein